MIHACRRIADRLVAMFEEDAEHWSDNQIADFALDDELAALLDEVFVNAVPYARRLLRQLEERGWRGWTRSNASTPVIAGNRQAASTSTANCWPLPTARHDGRPRFAPMSSGVGEVVVADAAGCGEWWSVCEQFRAAGRTLLWGVKGVVRVAGRAGGRCSA
jgi:hypothetical protein